MVNPVELKAKALEILVCANVENPNKVADAFAAPLSEELRLVKAWQGRNVALASRSSDNGVFTQTPTQEHAAAYQTALLSNLNDYAALITRNQAASSSYRTPTFTVDDATERAQIAIKESFFHPGVRNTYLD